jgi:hypothetical protein
MPDLDKKVENKHKLLEEQLALKKQKRLEKELSQKRRL